jgi:hypothetical protein
MDAAWVERLREVKSMNTNTTGGSQRYKAAMEQVIAVAPKHMTNRIKNIPFKSNTAGVHRKAIDKLLSECSELSQKPHSVLQQLMRKRPVDHVSAEVEGGRHDTVIAVEEDMCTGVLEARTDVEIFAAIGVHDLSEQTSGGLRRAYKRAALTLHPDKCKPDQRARATRAFTEMVAAFGRALRK